MRPSVTGTPLFSSLPRGRDGGHKDCYRERGERERGGQKDCCRARGEREAVRGADLVDERREVDRAAEVIAPQEAHGEVAPVEVLVT